MSDKMIADFFTKPLQGKKFQMLRDLVLNIRPEAVHRSMLVNNNFEDALPQNESQRQNTEAKGDVIPNEVEIENRESEEKKET
jgi:hypothetical protein